MYSQHFAHPNGCDGGKQRGGGARGDSELDFKLCKCTIGLKHESYILQYIMTVCYDIHIFQFFIQELFMFISSPHGIFPVSPVTSRI